MKVTASSLAALLNCPRFYQYAYEQRLDHIYASTEPLLMGSAFHKGMEMRDPYAGAALIQGDAYNQLDHDKLEIMQAIVVGMVTGALMMWPNYETEQEVEFELPFHVDDSPHMLAGKIDGIDTTNGVWLVEYKTAAQFPSYSYADKLPLNLQNRIYTWAAHQLYGRIDGTHYCVVRKPSIRPRKGESIKEFTARVIQDYQTRPEFYYRKESVSQSGMCFKDLEQHIWSLLLVLDHYRSMDYWPQNTSRCDDWQGCKYLPLCLGTEDAEIFYRQKESQHTELEVS